MEGEGQKIELKQGVCEPAPAMPKVMADIVTSCFQSIKTLIFNATTTSSGLCDGLDSVFIEWQGSDEIIVVNDFAPMADFDRQPVDFECIFTATDRNFTEPLELKSFKLVALVFAPALEVRQFNALQVFLDELVRAGFTVENEVTVGLFEN